MTLTCISNLAGNQHFQFVKRGHDTFVLSSLNQDSVIATCDEFKPSESPLDYGAFVSFLHRDKQVVGEKGKNSKAKVKPPTTFLAGQVFPKYGEWREHNGGFDNYKAFMRSFSQMHVFTKSITNPDQTVEDLYSCRRCFVSRVNTFADRVLKSGGKRAKEESSESSSDSDLDEEMQKQLLKLLKKKSKKSAKKDKGE